jgi:hypothetical protein
MSDATVGYAKIAAIMTSAREAIADREIVGVHADTSSDHSAPQDPARLTLQS